jgi:hypothetical protein
MNSPSNKPPSSPWIAASFFVVAGLILVVPAAFGPFDSDSLVGLGIGLVIAGLIFMFFGWLNFHRRKLIVETAPNAVVLNFIAYDELVPQLAALSQALGMDSPQFRVGGTASIAVDRETITFYRGSFSPVKFFEVPTRLLSRLTIERVRQQRWVLRTLTMSFSVGGMVLPLNICVVRPGFSFPTVLGKRGLEALSAGLSIYVE